MSKVDHRLFIAGKEVTRRKAFLHWLSSKTFSEANGRTRNDIWRIALDGDENGNHNPNGEVEHLIEAGIILK